MRNSRAHEMGSQSAPWWTTFVAAGLGASVAEICTLPIDTAKVRLQLLQRATVGVGAEAALRPPPPGMLAMVRAIAMTEGPRALFSGLAPALHRQLINASLRVGLYGHIAALFRASPPPGTAATDVPLGTKVAAALASGAIGITVANVSGSC